MEITGQGIFYVDRDQSSMLYVMDRDGGQIKRVDMGVGNLAVSGETYWQRQRELEDFKENRINGTSLSNLQTYGHYAQDNEGNVYFSAEDKISGSNGFYSIWNATFKLSKEGELKKMCSESGNFYNITGDTLYFHDYGEIVRINADGSGKRVIAEKKVNYMQLYQDYIYYTDAETNYIGRMTLDGTEEQVLVANSAESVNIAGDAIYYINKDDDHKLYRADLDGKNKLPLERNEAIELNPRAKYAVVDNGYIYYTSYKNSKLCRFNIETQMDEVVARGDLGDFNVVGQWIYYTKGHFDDAALYKIKINGFSNTAVASGGFEYINIIGDTIYYTSRNNSFSSVSMMMKTDGTEPKVMKKPLR